MTSEKLAHVHLVTCVGVDTEYAHFPHFIEHYRALGILPANFHVILNSTDASSPNLERAKALLAEQGIAAPETWIAPYTSDSMWAKRREIQARAVPPEHWVISADVDEFHDYPDELSTILAECDSRGVNCVQGVFIDRLASGGALVSVQPDKPIWETFPIETDVQCTVGQRGQHHNWAGTVKVMALKGSLFPSRGGHHPRPSDVPVNYMLGRHLATFPAIGDAKFRFTVPLRVHHFKWTASMPHTLRGRLATPGVSPAGAEYGEKLLDYLDKHNGVRLADVPIRRSDSFHRGSWRRKVLYLRALGAMHKLIDKPRKLARHLFRRLRP